MFGCASMLWVRGDLDGGPMDYRRFTGVLAQHAGTIRGVARDRARRSRDRHVGTDRLGDQAGGGGRREVTEGPRRVARPPYAWSGGLSARRRDQGARRLLGNVAEERADDHRQRDVDQRVRERRLEQRVELGG